MEPEFNDASDILDGVHIIAWEWPSESSELPCMLFEPFSDIIGALWHHLSILKNRKFVRVLKGRKTGGDGL